MYIGIKQIKEKYRIDLRGIIHLGAHLGEEAKDYAEVGCKNVIWIEGNPDLIDELKSNVSVYDGNRVFNILISEEDKKKVVFNITEFSQSSSILDLGITKEIHDTKIIEKKEIVARRIDSFFEEQHIDCKKYNFLNIDLQGYELNALKSLGNMLNDIDWIYTEVNSRTLYKNCTLLDELDLFLLKRGFSRVELYMTDWYWGDALYKRENIGKKEYLVKQANIIGWSIKNRVFDKVTRRAGEVRKYLGRIKRKILGNG
jgi:FkbM family methyltransferase